MSRARVICLLVLLLVVVTPRTSRATRVVVPDDVATVQLAIDGTADTVAVRPGLTPERVTASRPIVLEPADAIGSPADPRPVLQSLEVAPPAYPPSTTSVRGFHVLGELLVSPDQFWLSDSIRFTACVLDSGMIGPYDYSTSLRCQVWNCRVNGNLDVHAGYTSLVADTVANGTMTVGGDGTHEIRDNLIVGPAPVGLEVSLDTSQGILEDNVIRGVGVGLRVIYGGGTTVRRNVIEDCSGHGIEVAPNYPEGLVRLRENTIRRCGGDGIHVNAEVAGAFICNNVIEDVAGDGIYASSSTFVMNADSNRVLRVGGNGIVLRGAFAVGNVVGRCGQTGMDLQVDTIERNTLFSNGGAGIRLENSSAGCSYFTVHQNLSAMNVGPGLSWDASCASALDCNDWYANLGGATQGIAPASTDLAVDPLFCDLPGNDVHLASSSPLLSASGCGLIGADSVGCELTTDVTSPSVVTAAAFRVSPQPTGSAVTFSWRPDEARSIEVFDVTGALRWRATPQAGRREFAWDGRGSDGAPLPAGVYLARLRTERGPAPSTRIVIVR